MILRVLTLANSPLELADIFRIGHRDVSYPYLSAP